MVIFPMAVKSSGKMFKVGLVLFWVDSIEQNKGQAGAGLESRIRLISCIYNYDNWGVCSNNIFESFF